MPVTFTVTNQSAVATVSDWTDSVYLSPTPTFDPTTATFVNTFETNGYIGGKEIDLAPLAAGASYTRTVNVTLPAVATGAQYLVVVADDDDLSNDFGTIIRISPTPIWRTMPASAAITLSAPDLTITTASAPSAAIEGQSINVSWTTKNIGSTAAPGDWTDRSS